jgi:hypothetical protein
MNTCRVSSVKCRVVGDERFTLVGREKKLPIALRPGPERTAQS